MLASAAAADAQTAHELSASSTARIEITGEGTVVMRARNAKLVPYVLYDGEAHKPRLATITADVRTRTDAEGVDPASTVSFTVDDLSDATPKRLSSFSGAGAEGEIVAERYGAVTLPGCCAGPDIHNVRALETGQALFRATGPGAMGTVAWAEAPNAKPRTVRWAAFDGVVDDAEAEQGVLGRIRYGSDQGRLSSVELRATSRNDDLALGLSHAAVLVWIDPKPAASGDSRTPASGDPGAPQPIWAIEGISEPARLGGFRLVLTLDRHRLMTIPIEHDRLVTKRAMTSHGIAVRAAAE